MKRLDCEQGSDEWFEARAGLCTVSEFSRFITPARGDYSKQAVGYIADLIVESTEGPQEGVNSGWMDRGKLLEGEARDWYEFRRGEEVQTVGLILNKGSGWSPDGEVGEPGGIEIKCPKPSTHIKWLLDGSMPSEHLPQVHGALVVGEKDWIDFLSYCPRYKPLLVRVERSDYTKKVEKALSRFLEEYEKAKALVTA